MLRFLRDRDLRNAGFSLLEISIAVSIVLLLTVSVGGAAYRNYQSDLKQQTVDAATSDAYAKALEAVQDFDDSTTVESVLKSVNDANAGNGSGNHKIVVSKQSKSETKEDLCIVGSWADDSDYSSKKGNCIDPVVS